MDKDKSGVLSRQEVKDAYIKVCAIMAPDKFPID
jgi:hypothetical protein